MMLRSSMPTVVVDASAAVELLLRTPAGRQVHNGLRASTAAAPAHFDAEVFSAVGRLARDRVISDVLVVPALVELARAPILRLPVPPLLEEAWSLRDNVSLRDALYVVLARRLQASLLTADARLARVPRLGVPVTVVTA